MTHTGQEWPLLANALADQIPSNALHPAATRQLREIQQKPIALLCSGGADSLALVLLMWAFFPETRSRMYVLHFNHKLRAEAADDDAAFVASLAKGLDLPCRIGQSKAPQEAPSEAVLREERMRFVFAEANALGVAALLTGHQKNDILESQLMRLIRGSGTEGLAAPRAAQLFADGIWHIRPLLSISSRHIRDALSAVGAHWREDASNAEDLYLRNRMRHQIIPRLEEIGGRDVVQAAAYSRELLEEDARALELWAARAVVEASNPDGLKREAVEMLPTAIQRRVLYTWLSAQRPSMSIDRSTMTAMLGIIAEKKQTQLSLADDFLLNFESTLLSCIKTKSVVQPAEWGSVPLAAGSRLYMPGNHCLRIILCDIDPALLAHILSGSVDESRMAYLSTDFMPLRVRRWEAGDRYRPLGVSGSKKLQDIFVDRRIPKSRRHTLPVIASAKDDTILWVPGLPIAEAAKLSSDSQKALLLTYEYSC